jgi:hypothetical protein
VTDPSDNPISDLELMAYHDGELDDARAREVEDFLADDSLAADDARAKLAGLALVGAMMREQIDGDARADAVADEVMAALDGDIDAKLGKRPKLDGAPPANDNAGRLYMLAVAAAAVAAGLFVWGKTAPDETVALDRTGPTSIAIEAPPPAPSIDGERASASSDEDEALGVEIAAVDFGSQSGSVFYVPGGARGATAVVWVTDMGEQP